MKFDNSNSSLSPDDNEYLARLCRRAESPENYYEKGIRYGISLFRKAASFQVLTQIAECAEADKRFHWTEFKQGFVDTLRILIAIYSDGMFFGLVTKRNEDFVSADDAEYFERKNNRQVMKDRK